jgi:hypothetical protein
MSDRSFSIQTESGTTGTTKSEVSQRTDPRQETWKMAADLAGKIAWPVTVVAILVYFKSAIGRVIEQIGTRGGEVSFGGLGIKLPVMERAAVDDDVLLFKTTDPMQITNDSAKRTLLRMLREPGLREYSVINLGEGNEWISSRLFIFAIMLQRMKGIQCIVFLEGSPPKFLGLASPEHVRWSLAQDQPWLEQAYANAYASNLYYQQEESFIVSKYGALDGQTADNVVRNYIQRVTQSPTTPMPLTVRPWATLGNSTEYGTWLFSSGIQRILGETLRKEMIVESSDRRTEAKALLQCSAPYVARVKSTGEFISVISRVGFVNEMTTKLVARLGLLNAPSAKSQD